jgi:multidrug resistance efflux pump
MIDTPNINEAMATVRQALGELSTYGSHALEIPTEMPAYKAFEYIIKTWERPDLLEMFDELRAELEHLRLQVGAWEKTYDLMQAELEQVSHELTQLRLDYRATCQARDEYAAELEQARKGLPGPPVEGWKKLRKAQAQLRIAREALERVVALESRTYSNATDYHADIVAAIAVARQALTHLEGEGI